MKTLIKEYQATGEDKELLETLNGYVDEDLTALRYTGESPDVNDGLKYVAYRIRAFMMKNTFASRNARNVTERSNLSEDYDGLHEFLYGLYEADWIPLDWRALNNYDFSSIYENEAEVREFLASTQYDFFSLLENFKGLGQGSDEFKADFDVTKRDLLPLFIDGFLYAVGKVDTDREDKEMVKYINKAMLTKFIELQMKRDNVKRIRRGNNSVYLKVDTNESEHDAWMLLFGKTLKNIGGVEAFKLWFTPAQMKFAKEVFEIVDRDLRENNVDAFRWKQNGTPLINKRYLSQQMNLQEANFKQKLKRCNEKIDENWKEVIEEHFG